MTLRTLTYGNYGIFLIMRNAGFIPSTVPCSRWVDSVKARAGHGVVGSWGGECPPDLGFIGCRVEGLGFLRSRLIWGFCKSFSRSPDFGPLTQLENKDVFRIPSCIGARAREQYVWRVVGFRV